MQHPVVSQVAEGMNDVMQSVSVRQQVARERESMTLGAKRYSDELDFEPLTVLPSAGVGSVAPTATARPAGSSGLPISLGVSAGLASLLRLDFERFKFAVSVGVGASPPAAPASLFSKSCTVVLDSSMSVGFSPIEPPSSSPRV